MIKLSMFTTIFLLATSFVSGQSLNATNGGYPEKEVIKGKKYRVVYYEHAIEKPTEEVWAEVAGNYMDVGKVSLAITEAHAITSEQREGIGAKRFCAIDFGKRKVTVKEEVIDYHIASKKKQFTYEVYESEGFPAKVLNTWVVRTGDDGKTYLGTAFKVRANFAPMTGMLVKQLKKQGGVKNGVLAYKHFLEKGEGNVDPLVLNELYPEQI